MENPGRPLKVLGTGYLSISSRIYTGGSFGSNQTIHSDHERDCFTEYFHYIKSMLRLGRGKPSTKEKGGNLEI